MANQIRWYLKLALNYQNSLVFSQTRLISQKFLLQCTIDEDVPQESKQILEKQKLTIDLRDNDNKGHIDNARSFSKKRAIVELSKVLCLSKANAEEAITKNPALETLSPYEIRKNYYILRAAQIDVSTIMDNIQLLALSSTILTERIKCLKKTDMDINLLVPFMELSTKRLLKIISILKTDKNTISCNRIKYLSEKLNCREVEVCKKLTKYSNISSMPINDIVTKTELFLNGGISPEYIFNDLNSYVYSMERINERITEVKKIGLTPIKPWIFRVNPEKWKKLEKKGHLQDLPLLLKSMSNMFNCDENKIRGLLSKKTKRTSFHKVLKISELLHANGYTIDDIWLSPSILNRKYETIESYIRMYKEAGFERMTLSNLKLSKEQLKKLIESRLAMKENKM